MTHVFVSYSRRDKSTVARLCDDLRHRGLPTWIDLQDIPPGEPWASEIETAIRDCAFFLLALSPASVVSAYVRKEFLCALEREKKIIPVLLEACSIPGEIAPIQYVDMRDYQAGLRRLLAIFPESLFDEAMTVDRLFQQLQSPVPDIRTTALYTIGSGNIVETLDAVINALNDSDAEVRVAAAFALQRFKQLDAIPALIAALADPVFNVRTNAGWALVTIGPDVVPALDAMLQAGAAPDARDMAFEVLSRVGGPAAREVLKKHSG